MKKIFLISYALMMCAIAANAQCVYPTDNVTINFKRKPAGLMETGQFSVSAGQKVYFSGGNLQYQASSGTWRIAAKQYTYIGNSAGNNVSSNRDTQTGWIDLFGWGTSGWDNGNRVAYQPWETSETNSDYGVKATKASDETLTGEYANGDWGVYNFTSLGRGWRTLTRDEWQYLTISRPDSKLGTVKGTKARCTGAKILTDGTAPNKNIYGIIIFPDNYSGGTPAGVSWGTINGCNGSWGTTCTTAGWEALEAAGCVFLPSAGSRYGASTGWDGLDGGCYYWSSTAYSATQAYFFRGRKDEVTMYYVYRYAGFSVRLVQNVPND